MLSSRDASLCVCYSSSDVSPITAGILTILPAVSSTVLNAVWRCILRTSIKSSSTTAHLTSRWCILNLLLSHASAATPLLFLSDAPSSPPYTFCNGVIFGRF
ncbi:hypothetical protein B0H14DRAFT_2986390, partial [Mycena olivaceomarginata]